MFCAEILKKKERSCVAFIYGENDSRIIIRIIDSELKYVSLAPNGSTIYMIQPKDIKKFVKDFAALFGKTLKAVILRIFELKNIPGYTKNSDICAHFKTIFDALNLPFRFLTRDQEQCSTMITAAADLGLNNIQADDKVLTISICNINVRVTALKFTNAGYFFYRELDSLIKGADGVDDLMEKILKNVKPKKIIICKFSTADANRFQDFKNNLIQYQNLILLEQNFSEYTNMFMFEMGKWILDNKSWKYYIPPMPLTISEIRESFGKLLLSIDKKEFLPQTKSCILSKSVTMIKEINENGKTRNHKIDQKFHRNKIILSVDENNFYKFEIAPLILPQINSLLSTLNKNLKSKIPVIGFCDNFSVICIYNFNKNGYQFAESWNGIYGTELFIDFSGEKPVCCRQENLNKINVLPISQFIVYDLINILSMPSEDAMEAKELWNFKITKDDENSVLLNINTKMGENFASPAFLMALLIKEHRKIIKNETDKKPEKIGFCILDESYGIEKNERIKKGLKASCDLLKVECEFVEI